MHQDWHSIRQWRIATRAHLIAERRQLPRREKARRTAAITRLLAEEAPALEDRRVGFYWPLRGEVDLVPLMRRSDGARELALPVIVEKQHPLEFWRWTARMKLCTRGIWNIPSPIERRLVAPDLLLIPLVGFDDAGYRLGWGGGYYDRTLARLVPRPVLIGVGYESASLESIQPQPHDIPMDFIVTEERVRSFARSGEAVRGAQ